MTWTKTPAKEKKTDAADYFVQISPSELEAIVSVIEEGDPIKGTKPDMVLQAVKRDLANAKRYKRDKQARSQSVTKLATSLSSSVTFGLGASALAQVIPGIAGVSIAAAAIGAAVGWIVAGASEKKEKKRVNESA